MFCTARKKLLESTKVRLLADSIAIIQTPVYQLLQPRAAYGLECSNLGYIGVPKGPDIPEESMWHLPKLLISTSFFFVLKHSEMG